MERIFEYTADPLIAQFRNGTDPDFNAMRRMPVLFMGEGREDEIARVGRIVEVEVLRGREVTVTCTFEGEILGIQNRVIEEMAAELQMADWEFTRNRWAIKDVDFFRALMRRNLRRRVGPRSRRNRPAAGRAAAPG